MKKHLLSILFISFSLLTLAQANMPGNKDFTSSRRFFKMQYPDNWSTYENPDGTYHFEELNVGVGNVELKESRSFSDSIEIMHYLENESFSHPNAKYQYDPDKTVLHYNSMLIVEGKDRFVLVWLVANRNTVLTCRYSVDNKLKNDQKTQTEIMKVYQMIQSITFL